MLLFFYTINRVLALKGPCLTEPCLSLKIHDFFFKMALKPIKA